LLYWNRSSVLIRLSVRCHTKT